MSFSTEWEDRFKEGTQMSIWPWSDLITYVMRYAKPDKKTAGYAIKGRSQRIGSTGSAVHPFRLAPKFQLYSIRIP